MILNATGRKVTEYGRSYGLRDMTPAPFEDSKKILKSEGSQREKAIRLGAVVLLELERWCVYLKIRGVCIPKDDVVDTDVMRSMIEPFGVKVIVDPS